MLKLAVIGAQTLLGRELVGALETQEASVVPLSTGPLTLEEEEGDLVMFAPDPALLEGLDAVLLADVPGPGQLDTYHGKLLDLRPEPDMKLDPMPLAGGWPQGVGALRVRPALEQVLTLLPALVEHLGEVAGTHLRPVAWLGDRGLDGLMEQSVAVLQGEDPDTARLGYRQAFEVVPVPALAGKGRLLEVRVPVFHGDLLILHLRAAEGQRLARKEPPEGVRWTQAPPSSREVAVSSDLLAYLEASGDGQSATLTLGFDPILWGVMRPALRVLGLLGA
jgi:hypothetical protein